MNQGNPITEKQKEQNEYTNASRYIMYLLKGALNQTVLRNLPTDCTWGVIWEIANRNCIEALIGNYIQKYGEIVPAEIRDTGKKFIMKCCIVKYALTWNMKKLQGNWKIRN